MTSSTTHRGTRPLPGAALCFVLALLCPIAAWGGPLLYAAGDGDIEEMTRLLAAGADPNKQWDLGATHHGVTALHWAALHGRDEAIGFLGRAGAMPNIQNFNDGDTPLHYAAWSGYPGAVAALLRAGADASVRNRGGFTALHSAASLGSAESVRLLLGAGADPLALSRRRGPRAAQRNPCGDCRLLPQGGAAGRPPALDRHHRHFGEGDAVRRGAARRCAGAEAAGEAEHRPEHGERRGRVCAAARRGGEQRRRGHRRPVRGRRRHERPRRRRGHAARRCRQGGCHRGHRRAAYGLHAERCERRRHPPPSRACSPPAPTRTRTTATASPHCTAPPATVTPLSSSSCSQPAPTRP